MSCFILARLHTDLECMYSIRAALHLDVNMNTRLSLHWQFCARGWIVIYFETRPLILHAIRIQVIFSTGNLDVGVVFFLQDRSCRIDYLETVECLHYLRLDRIALRSTSKQESRKLFDC